MLPFISEINWEDCVQKVIYYKKLLLYIDNDLAVTVFIDLKKAFKVIAHKVKSKNFNHDNSHFRSRKQFIMVNGSLSDFWSEFYISVAHFF